MDKENFDKYDTRNTDKFGWRSEDGSVEYEPSEHRRAQRRTQQERGVRPRAGGGRPPKGGRTGQTAHTNRSGRRPPPRRPRTGRRGKRSQTLALFSLITVFVGIVGIFLIAVLLFPVIFPGNEEGGTRPPANVEGTAPPVTSGGTPATGSVTARGVISAINTTARTIVISDFENDVSLNLTADVAADFRVGNNDPAMITDFAAGDFVSVTFLAEDGAVTALSRPGDHHFLDIGMVRNIGIPSPVTGVTVNSAEGRIMHGVNSFLFGDELVVLHNGQPFDVNEIHTIDEVSMRTVGSSVVFINVVRRHGFVAFTDNPQISGPFAEIDRVSHAVTDQPVRVLEGEHRVRVTGRNINQRTFDVTVVAGQTSIVNISDVTFNAGYITITADRPVTLTLNGMSVPLDQPVYRPFGDIRIRAEAEGYSVFEMDEHFGLPEQTFHIEMERMPDAPPPATPPPQQQTPPPQATPRPPQTQTARITIVSSPDEAQVWMTRPGSIYPEYMGNTPLDPMNLEHGVYTFMFVREGFTPVTFSDFVIDASRNHQTWGPTLQPVGVG